MIQLSSSIIDRLSQTLFEHDVLLKMFVRNSIYTQIDIYPLVDIFNCLSSAVLLLLLCLYSQQMANVYFKFSPPDDDTMPVHFTSRSSCHQCEHIHILWSSSRTIDIAPPFAHC